MKENFTLIGIDGGATKVSGWIVNFSQEPLSFTLSEINEQLKYSEIHGFIPDYTPVPVQEQLKQAEEKEINLTDQEKQQGEVLIETCASVIELLADKNKGKPILVGIGMPGLKTEDQRGINVVANGPRMPEYAHKLESKLKDKNIIRPKRKAQTIFYSLSTEYEKLFSPFFGLIEGNKIMETV